MTPHYASEYWPTLAAAAVMLANLTDAKLRSIHKLGPTQCQQWWLSAAADAETRADELARELDAVKAELASLRDELRHALEMAEAAEQEAAEGRSQADRAERRLAAAKVGLVIAHGQIVFVPRTTQRCV